ncbi:MAG: S8 family serine peptidase [Anaerolineae bacterium]|nr:S8 family serine peptidase [Anaerolineae bacterium]
MKQVKYLLILVALFAIAATAGAATDSGNRSADGQTSNWYAVINHEANTSGAAEYIVLLDEPAAAVYTGGVQGLAPARSSADAALAYAGYLQAQQNDFVNGIETQFGRDIDVVTTMQYALNGVIMVLEPDEAVALVSNPAVTHIERAVDQEILTDAGPTWIGANEVWDGTATGMEALGDGVVIAVLDSGVNYDHISFAATDKFGYTITNPLGDGVYLGACDPTNVEQYDPNATCNSKLIGAYDVLNLSPTLPNGEDENGHGSHTASTTSGNFVDAVVEAPALTGDLVSQISGVAPHANLITYDVCSSNGGQSCSGAALAAAPDIVAMNIMVDGANIRALNYSISGGSNPYNDAVELGFLNLSDLGVFVSASAGNSGPTPGTVAHVSPWVNTTAASTHNRTYPNRLINMAGGAAPADMNGAGITDGYGPAPIVYAGDFSNGDPNPEQCLNPFPPGTWTNGEIVVCDRGTIARVDKGANVLAGGAGGFVLANVDAQGESIAGDRHFLPAVHVGDTNGDQLRAWLAANPVGSLTAEIEGFLGTDLDPANGDIMADFSSRGPNNTFDVLKPNVTAPGVTILAAVADGGVGHPESPPEYDYLQGTSMSSPHAAGAGALMAEVHPDWTPHQIKSAIMMSAVNATVVKEDGSTPADAFDQGAGSVRVNKAAVAGLTLNETTANFIAANPILGGDPAALNVASMQNSDCAGSCSWTRTVQSVLDTTQEWDASLVMPVGMTGSVTPSNFTLAPGATQELTIEVDGSGLPAGSWAFAQLNLDPAPARAPISAPETTAASTPDTWTDEVTDNAGANNVLPPAGVEIWQAPSAVLYDNGPLVNCAGCGGGGADASRLQSSLGMTTLGFGHQVLNDNWVADDFTVSDAEGWTLDSVTFFAYQTNSTTTSTMTDVNWLVYDGQPGAGGTVIASGSGIDASVWSGIYRDSETSAGNTARPIMATTVGLGAISLPAGDYWLAWQTDGTLASGPWAPPITINGQSTTGNGLQSLAGTNAWAPANDTGSLTQQGFPFIIEGTVGTSGGGGDVLAAHMPIAIIPSGSGTPPSIVLDPALLSATQAPDTMTTQTLNVGNVGDQTLDWSIYEDAGATRYFVDWMDNFDSYATGQDLQGVGGWKGWFNDPAASASTTDAQALSAPNSVDIVGAADLVHEYSVDDGFWTYTAYQYVPGNMTGDSFFILLNQYDDAGASNNWSVQVHMNGDTNLVLADGIGAGSQLPLIRDQWVELRVEIDLVNDFQEFYYDNQLLYSGSWSDGVSGGGITSIGAVDLFANTGTSVYYDDMSLIEQVAGTCDLSSDIPWVSVNPTSGSTAGNSSTPVDVTFDSTGLAEGTYNGTLCVESNDAAQPLVEVPVELIVDAGAGGGDLACNIDPIAFESGLPASWSVDTPFGTVYWSTTDDLAACDNGGNQTLGSGEAACADSDETNVPGDPYDTSLVTNAIDLSGYNSVSLDFAVNYNDIDASGGDMFSVEVSTDGGATWTSELSWNSDHNEIASVDLSSYGGNANVLVRFRYAGLGWDWWAQVDDVSLTCADAGVGPIIEVDPDTVHSSQQTNTTNDETFNINNLGDADLDWNIYEDAAFPMGPVSAGRTVATLNAKGIDGTAIGDASFTAAGTDTGVRATPESQANRDLVTITQSATNNIVQFNSVSCNAGGLHTDNSYLRVFDLMSYGITDDFDVTEVEIGVEQALGATGSQPIDVNLYILTDPNAPLTFGNLTPIGSTSTMVSDQSLSLWSTPVMGTAPAGSMLVVEIFTPDGQTTGNSFFIGSNPDGQTGPSYLAAAACGVPEPLDTAALGFPGMHIVMNVTGDTTPPMADVCDVASDISWASVAPDMGTTPAMGSDTVTVTFDSTGLLPGEYEGTLCVESNDPQNPLVTVLLQLWVEEPPTAVEMADLSATVNADGSVTVAWETAAEVANAGFNVYRSVSADALGEMVNGALIASTASAGAGASYSFTDSAVGAGIFYYWVEAVATDGTTFAHGPVEAVTQAPTSAGLSGFGGGSSTALPLVLVAVLAVALLGAAFVNRRKA